LVRSKRVLTGYICAVTAAAFFGSVTTLSKPVLADVSPVLLSSLVYIVSGVTITPIAQRNQITRTEKKYYLLVVLTAIIGACVGPIMFFSGLRLTTAADVTILSNGETVFSILFALLFFKEKISR
jgi:drug/metabolite transporter (DMT)-like permease